MSYRKAESVLPDEVIRLIQTYIDGECIYIPRKDENRKYWGEQTTTRKEIRIRNKEIYKGYLAGENVSCLAKLYYLSEKSIQRIVLSQKREEKKKSE